MHSVCRCSLPVWRRSFLKKVTPCDLFWPRPGSAPGGIWPKNNNTCKGPWVLHPYQVSSKSIKRFWRRSWKCESLRTTTTTDDGRRRTTTDDDGRTDDGRCAMTIAHLSLRLRWAKKRGTRKTCNASRWGCGRIHCDMQESTATSSACKCLMQRLPILYRFLLIWFLKETHESVLD